MALEASATTTWECPIGSEPIRIEQDAQINPPGVLAVRGTTRLITFLLINNENAEVEVAFREAINQPFC